MEPHNRNLFNGGIQSVKADDIERLFSTKAAAIKFMHEQQRKCPIKKSYHKNSRDLYRSILEHQLGIREANPWWIQARL